MGNWAVVHTQMQKSRMPPYDDIYKLAGQLHSVFECCVVPRKAAGVSHYPLHPSDLGQKFLSDAYDAGDPPQSREVGALAALVLNHIPIRNTSKFLSWNQQGVKKQKTSDAFMQKLDMFMERFSQKQEPEQPSSSSLLLLKPGKQATVAPASLLQTSQLQNQVEQQQVVAESTPAVCAEAGMQQVTEQPSSPAQADFPEKQEDPAVELPEAGLGKPSNNFLQSLEDFEKQAYESLQAGSKSKKGNVTLKKPAAFDAGLTKKPAAHSKILRAFCCSAGACQE